MNIIEIKIGDIIPYEKNPRKNDDAVKYVAESIKQFGFKVPIVIDKNNVIIAGHTRYKASKKLGLKEVPCIVADDLTEEQIKVPFCKLCHLVVSQSVCLDLFFC